MTLVPVLEIGGTHATALHVDAASWTVPPGRVPEAALHADGTAGDLLDTLAGCVQSLDPLAGTTLAVAIPGPFDYARGIGWFRDVGKFDALYGVDVGAGLAARLAKAPERIVFVNDAAAFALGEYQFGAARGTRRAVAITLGTGIGSAFVADGAVVSAGPTVPPDGHVYRLLVAGQPLESVVSRRAIQARYGHEQIDVLQIAERAGAGDELARLAFTEPWCTLGAALAPWLAAFAAQVLVVGGAMSRSWSLVAPALRSGLQAGQPAVDLPVRKARDAQKAAALGAAWHALGAAQATIRDEHR